jgi:hypothetical protein
MRYFDPVILAGCKGMWRGVKGDSYGDDVHVLQEHKLSVAEE